MTPSEFKAWFDGFTEAFDGRIPTKAQWARVKDRVAEIDGKPITERVYIDRYYSHYWQQPRYSYPSVWCTATSGGLSAAMSGSHTITNACNQTALGSGAAVFDGTVAMAALGRAEAASLGGAQ